MLYLLLIHLFWLQSEAAHNGCHLLPQNHTIHCANISMAEVAASYHTIQVPPTHNCTPIIEEDLKITCTPSFSDHASSVRSLVVEDCSRLLDEEVGVFFDLSRNVESARFHRCPRPHLRSTSLTELDLSECGLDEVPHLSHLIGLKRLLLRGNNISRLPTTSWWPPSLVELDLADNRMDTLEGALPPNLTSLSLSGNGLSSLPLLHLPLRRLDLSRNRLRSLNVSRLTHLEYLNLRENLISSLDPPFHLKSLKRMDVRGNPLRCDCGLSSASHLLVLSSCPNLDCGAEEGGDDEVRPVALSSSSVQVQWKGEGALVYRREDDPPLKMTLVPVPPFIHFLRPSTTYVVCVARRTLPPTAYTVDPSKCRRVVTLPNTPRLLDLSVAATSVRLRWKADGKTEWRIRVKPSGSSDSVSTDHRFKSDSGPLHEFAVTDLEPRTDYDVCVEEAETVEGGGACVTVHTEGERQRISAAVGVALGLCALGLVGVAIIALCRRRRGRPITEEEEGDIAIAIGQHPLKEEEQVVEETFFERKEGGPKSYARSWSTLRLPHTGPPHSAPLFCSFRSPCGYRDHLTSVTIYSSGHSEC